MQHMQGMPPEPGTRHDWRVISRLLPYLWQFRGRVAVAMALLVAAKTANVLVPVTLKYIVDALDKTLQQPLQMLVVPLGLVFAYGALRFSSVFFGELRDAVFARVAERSLSAISLTVFRHLHQLDLGFHLDRRTGGISRDMERGTNGISFLLRSVVFSVVPILIEVVLVAIIMAITTDWLFAMIALAGVAGYVVFSVWMTNRRTGLIRTANQRDSDANHRAVDSLLNFETVKYFNNEDYEAARYEHDLRRREDAKVTNFYSLAVLNCGQALIIAISVTLVMWLAAVRVASGAMSLGDLAMVNAFMFQVFVPLNILGFVYREIRRALTDVEAMFGLLDIDPTIVDRAGAGAYEPAMDGIEFDHVGFGYHPQRPILRDLSFRVEPGQKVAIVGPSGAGKSTLARLLFRFYDLDSGSIRVGGVDIRDLQQDSWRGALGVVPQDTVLFNDTLRQNILYGRPDASAAELDAVVRLAHLEHFVNSLPEGLETRVGERGLKVSGGEKQRVAIARMLLKKPVIMLFDEATSSLDSASEHAILHALREVSENHTSLVIAHRLSTIVDADNIIVLDDGCVAESGSHGELMAQRGRYWQMWQLQQKQQQAAD
jgi:ABC-type transport system involved in Fe-S cluster assembly fused permease/ATPase subunit